ncbi:MAG: PLP-dependent aminotransferase family protein, partial [Bacteroidota bacterium]
MQLLMLAQKYRFAIIEDDYDYDFHFERSPILPMASSDTVGSVIYVGSLSKTIAPGLRTGYIVAPKNLITAISQISRNMDCHGNHALERAIAILYQDGEIKRYHKKSLLIYLKRRDLFCQLLREQLGDIVQFEVPKGGLAVWVKFDGRYPVQVIKRRALELGLRLPKSIFKNMDSKKVNAIRMGFASLEEEEMREAVEILRQATSQFL